MRATDDVGARKVNALSVRCVRYLKWLRWFEHVTGLQTEKGDSVFFFTANDNVQPRYPENGTAAAHECSPSLPREQRNKYRETDEAQLLLPHNGDIGRSLRHFLDAIHHLGGHEASGALEWPCTRRGDLVVVVVPAALLDNGVALFLVLRLGDALCCRTERLLQQEYEAMSRRDREN